MARQRPQTAEFELHDDDGSPVDFGKARREAQPAPAPAAAKEKASYRVRLNCPTPLAYRELVVEDCAGEDEARAKFCLANNISGSSHPWDVQRVG